MSLSLNHVAFYQELMAEGKIGSARGESGVKNNHLTLQSFTTSHILMCECLTVFPVWWLWHWNKCYIALSGSRTLQCQWCKQCTNCSLSLGAWRRKEMCISVILIMATHDSPNVICFCHHVVKLLTIEYSYTALLLNLVFTSLLFGTWCLIWNSDTLWNGQG